MNKRAALNCYFFFFSTGRDLAGATNSLVNTVLLNVWGILFTTAS